MSAPEIVERARRLLADAKRDEAAALAIYHEAGRVRQVAADAFAAAVAAYAGHWPGKRIRHRGREYEVAGAQWEWERPIVTGVLLGRDGALTEVTHRLFHVELDRLGI